MYQPARTGLSGGMQLDVQFDRRESTTRFDQAPDPAVGVPVDVVPVEEPADPEPTGSSYARCADGHGTLTHLFFSDDEFDVARAKAICGRCGLAARCLDGALERVEPYGVWGGKLVVDGVVVDGKRGRGRPPKTPRPPLVVDEVPVPPHLVA